ncbi:MAG: hypothetical protein ABII18_00740 [bacterium]|nr:hypothetical protein [bacterium]
MKKIIVVLAFFVFAVSFINCGTEQSLIPNLTDSEDPSQIRLWQVDEEGVSIIEIPLAAFGETEEDLTGALVGISVNDYAIADDLDPATYYVASVNLVAFQMGGLEDGDIIKFTIVNAGGAEVFYQGTFSTDDYATAIIVVLEPEEDGLAGSDSGEALIMITKPNKLLYSF